MASNEGKGADPWTKETKARFENKSKSEFFDPCQEAAERSLRCLRRNDYDKAFCGDYFQAYRDCKKQWITRWREDRAKEKNST